MKKSPLKNMIPLYQNDLDVEFEDICKFFFEVSHCSVFNRHSYFKKGLSEILYCFGQKFKPSRISEKAFASKHFGKPENLLDSEYYREWYKNRKKHLLFFEHFIPQGSLIDKCIECINLQQVRDLLSELEFVIILKEEDDVLRKNKFHIKGRETFQKATLAYKKFGIELQNII